MWRTHFDVSRGRAPSAGVAAARAGSSAWPRSASDVATKLAARPRPAVPPARLAIEGQRRRPDVLLHGLGLGHMTLDAGGKGTVGIQFTEK
jgi:hypothetical protein